MHGLGSSADAQRLFATSIVARLPPAMLGIGLLVHAQHLTGSFGAAGVVTGAYAGALGTGGPLLGKLVDRRGQTSALLASAGVAAVLLVAMAVLPAGVPLAALIVLAAGIGLATPPVGACLRTQLPSLLPDHGAVGAAYALEASMVELTYIFGPPLALCISALWSTGAALAFAGATLLAATAAFAVQPASRQWRPAPAGGRPRGGSLRTPAMVTLVIVLIAVGMLLGADEVAVTAAARSLDSTTAAAPLFARLGRRVVHRRLARHAPRRCSTQRPRTRAPARRAHRRAPRPHPGAWQRARPRRRAAPRRSRDRAHRGHRVRHASTTPPPPPT